MFPSTSSGNELWCSKKTAAPCAHRRDLLAKRHRCDWLSGRALAQKKNRRSLRPPEGLVGKHVSLRLAQRTDFGTAKKLPLHVPVEGACCQKKHRCDWLSERIWCSSWAWRCFSPPLSCQPVQRHGWIFPKQSYAAV